MVLHSGYSFQNRQDISNLLGGDTQKGITKSKKTPTILMFKNPGELYSDFFYPKGSYNFCMYTGIGRVGHQDSIENIMYNRNMDVLTHAATGRHLLLFDKEPLSYTFIGEYRLLETHQNVQPDDNGQLRRVFVFHLQKIADLYDCETPFQ